MKPINTSVHIHQPGHRSFVNIRMMPRLAKCLAAHIQGVIVVCKLVVVVNVDTCIHKTCCFDLFLTFLQGHENFRIFPHCTIDRGSLCEHQNSWTVWDWPSRWCWVIGTVYFSVVSCYIFNLATQGIIVTLVFVCVYVYACPRWRGGGVITLNEKFVARNLRSNVYLQYLFINPLFSECCYICCVVHITRLLGRPQPQMYPPVTLNQYTLVNRTHKHYIYMLQGPTNILKQGNQRWQTSPAAPPGGLGHSPTFWHQSRISTTIRSRYMAK